MWRLTQHPFTFPLLSDLGLQPNLTQPTARPMQCHIPYPTLFMDNFTQFNISFSAVLLGISHPVGRQSERTALSQVSAVYCW